MSNSTDGDPQIPDVSANQGYMVAEISQLLTSIQSLTATVGDLGQLVGDLQDRVAALESGTDE